MAARLSQLSMNGASQIYVGVEGRGGGGVMLLSATRNNIQTWISSEDLSISTQNGILVASRGLGGDILGSDVRESREMILRQGTGLAQRFHTFIDGENRAVTRSYICEIEPDGTQTITLNARQVRTKLVSEKCGNPDQQFSNTYWLDATTGHIVQSRQWAGAYIGMLALQQRPQQ